MYKRPRRPTQDRPRTQMAAVSNLESLVLLGGALLCGASFSAFGKAVSDSVASTTQSHELALSHESAHEGPTTQSQPGVSLVSSSHAAGASGLSRFARLVKEAAELAPSPSGLVPTGSYSDVLGASSSATQFLRAVDEIADATASQRPKIWRDVLLADVPRVDQVDFLRGGSHAGRPVLDSSELGQPSRRFPVREGLFTTDNIRAWEELSSKRWTSLSDTHRQEIFVDAPKRLYLQASSSGETLFAPLGWSDKYDVYEASVAALLKFGPDAMPSVRDFIARNLETAKRARDVDAQAQADLVTTTLAQLIAEAGLNAYAARRHNVPLSNMRDAMFLSDSYPRTANRLLVESSETLLARRIPNSFDWLSQVSAGLELRTTPEYLKTLMVRQFEPQ